MMDALLSSGAFAALSFGASAAVLLYYFLSRRLHRKRPTDYKCRNTNVRL